MYRFLLIRILFFFICTIANYMMRSVCASRNEFNEGESSNGIEVKKKYVWSNTNVKFIGINDGFGIISVIFSNEIKHYEFFHVFIRLKNVEIFFVCPKLVDNKTSSIPINLPRIYSKCSCSMTIVTENVNKWMNKIFVMRENFSWNSFGCYKLFEWKIKFWLQFCYVEFQLINEKYQHLQTSNYVYYKLMI